MNYKKIFKRETKVIAYVVIALTLVVIGTSYALFLQVNNNRENQVVTAGSLVIEYDHDNLLVVDENEANNCLLPQSDDTGSGSGGCSFTLSITNTGTLPMQYDLLIFDNTSEAPSGVEFVNHNLIKHSLNKQVSKEGSQKETIATAKLLSELEQKEGKRILESSVIDVGESITFSLKIWISDEAETDIIGQLVYLKLGVDGVVFERTTATDTLTEAKLTDLEEINLPSTYSVGTTNKEYRFTGANPNNYVMFNDELWRILGIYNDSQLKLIKEGEELELAFHDIEESDYANSTLKTYLNEDFYNSLSSEAKSQIRPTEFKTSGATSLEINALEMFGKELESEKGTLTSVGVMSASDYAFASSNKNEEVLSNLSSQNSNNWLYTSKAEWLINQEENNSVYSINTEGNITLGNVLEKKLVRPVVYLNSNVVLQSGEGTKENPYVLSK